VLDAALDEVHLTRQRRVLVRGPWRFPIMNSFAKFAAVAVAVIAIGAVGLAVLRPGDSSQVGGPPAASPSPSAVPAASPTPSPTPIPTAPALTGTFTSERHGLSLSYPEGWSTRPATAPWTTGFVDYMHPGGDVLYDPTLEADLWLSLASQPLGDRTRAEWEADVGEILVGDDPNATDCPSEGESIIVDGAQGIICTDLVVVTEGGRGYWIKLYTSGNPAWLGDTFDPEWFRQVLATVQLEPDQAVDAP
jgi:hypothetical protein